MKVPHDRLFHWKIPLHSTRAHAYSALCLTSGLASTIDNWTDFVLLITPASAAVLQEAVVMDLGGERLVVH